jgi:hypothetical protein
MKREIEYTNLSTQHEPVVAFPHDPTSRSQLPTDTGVTMSQFTTVNSKQSLFFHPLVTAYLDPFSPTHSVTLTPQPKTGAALRENN